MNRDLQTYLHVLESGSVTEASFRAILESFFSFTYRTEAIAESRSDTALVYCRILRCCQILLDNNTPNKLLDDIKKLLIQCFSNIERLFVETREEELRGSYIRAIWFLSELKTKASEGRTGEINQQVISEYAEELLDVFGDIHFIFDIEDEHGVLFPISKVIAAVIGGRNFQEFRNGIQIGDINTLRLAVRLFHSVEDEKVLDTLKSKCNLKFVDYLRTDCEIIDTVDFLNYQYNGTIIFHNDRKKTVLIRSEQQQYFGLHAKMDHQVQKEVDCNGKTIGWFVEYDLDPEDKLCDYSELLDNEKERIALLKLLYDDGFRNVFLQKSIIKKNDDSIAPINPYCTQDTRLIQGQLNSQNGRTYEATKIRELLRKYRICSVKSNVMNRVTFGLCALLLDICNVGVEALGLDSLVNDSWYQEQIIQNWMTRPETTVEHIRAMLESWYSQLQYCETTSRLEQESLHPQDFLPLQQKMISVYKRLCPTLVTDEGLFFGTIVEDSKDAFTVEVDLRATMSGQNYRNQDRRYINVNANNIQIVDEDFNWESKVGTDIWFFYSLKKETGHIINRSLLKSLAGVELLQMSGLPFVVGSHVTGIYYSSLSCYMKLFEDEFKKVASSTKVCLQNDLESQIYMRILHNLIWSKVDTAEKVENYFAIILAHQRADFSDICNDSVFSRPDQTTLYVPKDDNTQSAVLSMIYEKRLKNMLGRDQRNLYNDEVTLINGKYAVFNNVIEHVIVLTDNIVGGTSTVSALAAYLKIDPESDSQLHKDRVEKSDSTKHKYYCDGQEVSVRDIIIRNGASISVHAFYGTEKGSQKIDDFLGRHGFSYNQCSYSHELVNVANECHAKQARSIWGCCALLPGQYLYIREYNMPKITVFPDKMLENPQIMICLFSKNKELY